MQAFSRMLRPAAGNAARLATTRSSPSLAMARTAWATTQKVAFSPRWSSTSASTSGSAADVVQGEVVPDDEPEAPAAPAHVPTSSGQEKPAGQSEKHEFQAETRKLLDIVARSLYSEKEVFIRELVSNASDALEKLRYLRATGQDKSAPADRGRALQIDINTNKAARTITISDSGVGMNKEEMVANLGTIARSGSKAFMEEMQKKASVDPKDIIGQFGVGFYSAFMVADRIEVFSRSSSSLEAPAFHWESDGGGSYAVREAADVNPGTKIVVHLKADCAEFADEARVRDVIRKYSSFVGSDLFLNGNKSSELRPVWLMEPKEVSKDLHEDFYR